MSWAGLEGIFFLPLIQWPWLSWSGNSFYRRAWGHILILMGNFAHKVWVAIVDMPVYHLTPPDSSVGTGRAFNRHFSIAVYCCCLWHLNTCFDPKALLHIIFFPAFNWKTVWAGLVARAQGLELVLGICSFFQECFRLADSSLATRFPVFIRRPSITVFTSLCLLASLFASLSWALMVTTFGSDIW